MTDLDALCLADLSLFADLGTEAPHLVASGDDAVVRMVRNGRQVEIILKSSGSIIERDEDGERRHISMRALLASPNFGDLGRWADAQAALLKDLSNFSIPVSGDLDGIQVDLDYIEQNFDAPDGGSPQVRILLVDGPAGIGKTRLIQMMALRRATEYRSSRRPLILHVESRGRMLQNIMDLMAFSLQTLRLNIMYDQVPVFVRHGLVALAIDGFDELGDPSGYDLAWAQVNDLVAGVRGRGSLILAGRETFIGRERLIAALKGIRQDSDRIQGFTVNLPAPQIAKDWLKRSGWTDDIFLQENVSPLFERESYALRPFYLVELSRVGVLDQIQKGKIDDLTWFLVESMIARESGKFGRDVDTVTTAEVRSNFLRRFLGEVARDLAENQTDAIATDSLTWICEVVASDTVPDSLVGILKNRAAVVAFLTDDLRRGYKRFNHPQILNHFLSRVTIDSVADAEVPKYVRRNIFGADFLRSFSEVIGHIETKHVSTFLRNAVASIRDLGDQDRARRNLAALVIASASVADSNSKIILSNVSVDEALVAETAAPINLEGVVIAQLDARQADLRTFQFDENCHVIALIADAGTLLPDSFPRPQQIQLSKEVLTAPLDIERWMMSHANSGQGESPSSAIIPQNIRGHGMMELLRRICRYRFFWLRDTEDVAARRILDDPHWGVLRPLLDKHGFLVVREDRAAAGRRTEFFHFRRRELLMAETIEDPDALGFFQNLVAEILGQ